MKPIFKIRKKTLSEIVSDVERPHPIAFERLGCVFTKPASGDLDRPIILATHYRAIPDQHYLQDESVGARIGSAAIQALMQEVLDTRQGAFLVHLHAHRGVPSLSTTDTQEMLPLIFSLRNAAPAVPHGALLLSKDRVAGWALFPVEAHFTKLTKVSIVGFPMSLFL